MEKENVIFKIFPNERYLDMTLYQYGWEKCRPSHSYGPAARNHYLFHYIISGRGVLHSNDEHGSTHTHHLERNQAFLICPGQINTYIADKDEPWEYTWLEFDGLRAGEFMTAAGLDASSPIYRGSDRALREQMKEEMLTIVRQDASSMALIGHLYLFLDLLVRSSFNHRSITGGKLKDFYVREAIAFIEQNYSHSAVTIEDIAAFCNLNRSYLGKIFREALNQTPQQFLIFYRMNRAAELLKFSELSVGEIGKLVGYPNQLHFSRAFKSVFKQSPSYWRKENRH